MFLGIDLVPLKGQTGKEYLLNVHPITAQIAPVAGIYFVAKLWMEPDRRDPAVGLIYLGRTNNLSSCLNGHTHRSTFEKREANAVLLLQVDDDLARMAIQLDLSWMLNPSQQDALPQKS